MHRAKLLLLVSTHPRDQQDSPLLMSYLPDGHSKLLQQDEPCWSIGCGEISKSCYAQK